MNSRANALLLVLLGGVIAWRLYAVQDWTADVSSPALEDAQLFAAALEAGLLAPQDDGRLLPLAEDALLARRAAALAEGQTPAADPDRERLLAALYHSPAGRAVLDQIQLWNRTRRLAAVRDDAGAGQAARIRDWRPYDCQGRSLAAAGRVPEAFGYVHQGQLRPGFGDWTSSSTDAGCMAFRARFRAAAPVAVTIQYIGREQLPDARQLCPPRGDCQAGRWTAGRDGWRRQGDGWERDMNIRLAPAPFADPVVAGINIRLKDGKHAWEAQVAAGPRVAAAAGRVAVQTADGVALLDPEGRPTAAVNELGLLPVVGSSGAGDGGSIAGLLARSRIAGNHRLTLTLDSRVQAAAWESLREALRAFPADDPYRQARRAALVVLDDRGAIRAAAGWPEAPDPAQFTDWDLAAFSQVYPLDNPYQARAWSGVDRHNAPGSTFKTVTALAALDAGREGDDAAAEMVAGWRPDAFARNTGLTMGAHAYSPYRQAGLRDTHLSAFADNTLRNFRADRGGYETLGRMVGQPLRAAECAGGKAPLSRRLDLAAAVRDSVNIWFARLAVLMDGGAALDYDLGFWEGAERPIPPLRLAAWIKIMDIDQRLPLLAGVPDRLGRLSSDAGGASLLSPRPYPLLWILAQNAIGQGVQATPLHMARVAAVIANGRQVRAHLAGAWDGDDLTPRRGEALRLDLDRLRAGMKAVTETGTARTAFKSSPHRCQTYGKTGTAQVAKADGSGRLEPFNTVWFIGWREPQGDEPRLAFACMVTHARATGGELCAPRVAALLQRWQAGQ